jgi:hypothetical protein
MLSYVKGSGPLSQWALPGSNMAEVHKLRAIGLIPTTKRFWTSGKVDRAVSPSCRLYEPEARRDIPVRQSRWGHRDPPL